MNDLISRQATIDVEGLDEQIRCEMCRNPMHTNRGCDGNCKYDEKLYERIMQILGERIKPSPSAEPRKKGKWVKHSYGLILKSRWGECSVCGNILDFAGVNAGRGDANYCPNCGADMREGEESE